MYPTVPSLSLRGVDMGALFKLDGGASITKGCRTRTAIKAWFAVRETEGELLQ